MPLTARLRIALREYRYGHVTQKTLALEWGIGRSGVAMRLLRGRRASGEAKRAPALKRVRRRPASLSHFEDL